MNLGKPLKVKPTLPQREALSFLMEKGSGGIRLSTGLGKTYLALCVAAMFLKRDWVEVVYVVYPKPALQAFQATLSEMVEIDHVFLKESDGREALVELFQTNTLHKFEERILNDKRRKLVLIDEVQVIKKPTSKTRILMDKLRPGFDYVVGFTATPLGNHLEDFYWITQYMVPGSLGSFTEFRKRYCKLTLRKIKKAGRTIKFYEIKGYQNLDILRHKISQLWFSEIVSMDIVWHESHSFPMSEETAGRYLLVARGIVKGEFRDFVTRLPELQTVVDTSYEKVEFYRSYVAGLLSEGKGVIVYFALKVGVALLKAKFPEALVLTGDVSSPVKREKILSKFGPGKLLLMTSAGSRSFNFHAGNQVVFYDIPFEIETLIQTVGRVARPLVSSFDKIDVHLPRMEGSIDEYRYNMYLHNRDLVNLILEDGDPNVIRTLSGVKKSTLIKLRKDLLWKTKHGVDKLRK